MDDAEVPACFAARRLWRAARAATLATQDRGQPFASLVTPAVAPDGSALLLLSSLSAHTRHLAAEARCALMVSGVQDGANPQTAPRLTVTGRAVAEPDPAWRAYWLDRHPYAALYAGFGDFGLWRIDPDNGHFVAGFARAATLTAAELMPPPEAVAALHDAAPSIIAHCNADHAGALALLARTACLARMIGVDADGFDVAAGDAVHRVPFDTPVSDGPGVRAAMVRMVRAARHELDETTPLGAAPGAQGADR